MGTKNGSVPPDSLSLYKSFFDNTLDGLAYCQMIFDTQGRPTDYKYIKVNKNFEILTGLKGVVGKKVTEVIPWIEESNPELFEMYGHVAFTGETKKFEIYVTPLSRWFFISVYSPKKDFFIAIFQNITDQKKIQKDLEDAKIAAHNVLEDLQIEKEKLAAANAKDEALLGSIGDGVIATDENGIIVLINTKGEKLLGKKREEVIGKILSEVIPIEDEKGLPVPFEKRPMGMALSTRTTTTTTTAGATYYYMRKDKKTFPAAITVTPVILGGNVIGAIEVFRDITKEKEIDKAKTEFVSLASHQLRTPLSSVRWYSEMLLAGDAGVINEKQKQYLEEIQQGNLRMIGLVNILLHVSRLELGMAEVNIESVQLSKVVAEVLREVEPRRHTQDVSVEVQISDSLPPLMTDAKLIRIVVENLISNAIKYTKAQGVVEVAAQVVAAGESFGARMAGEKSVGFSVIDSGIGIPEAEHYKIFEKLYRTENAREMDTDGTGLGLYLARLVLGRLKGQIWFRSKVGEGTSFYVLLPYTVLDTEKKKHAVIELV